MNLPIIESPCPISRMKMDKTGHDYFCHSCAKKVVDYRGKSIETIKDSLQEGECGIFDENQLQLIPKYSFPKQIFFKWLTFISFIGFNVSPLKASTFLEKEPISKKEVKALKKEKKKYFKNVKRRKKSGRGYSGAISF